MQKRTPRITTEGIARYLKELREQERSDATIQKYAHDLTAFCASLTGSR